MVTESIAYRKALSFAKRIVLLAKHLNEAHHEYTLSKQILRSGTSSGTSIGANIAEARYGYSRKDFAAKIYIALKECGETLYWLELLFLTEYLSPEEYESLQQDCEEIRRILSATTKSTR
ncbi:MAG: four helix bundle protein [Oscillospiraceae bacterium]|nr:four helix bundle protein [Oscillospiraceae bacterium]